MYLRKCFSVFSTRLEFNGLLQLNKDDTYVEVFGCYLVSQAELWNGPITGA